MILVAGGQLDPNIGRLLRRMLERGSAFRDLIVGPSLVPQLRFKLGAQDIELNEELITPRACFIRHDVFLHEATGKHSESALNWYYTVRGWALSLPEIRMLNRHSYLSENNKLENLLLASRLGLKIPETIVTNKFPSADGEWIVKPVAGGAYTTALSQFMDSNRPNGATYPRLLQRRLARPELRIYRIGKALLAFELDSSAVDYRTTQDVRIVETTVPPEIGSLLVCLCDEIGLDFGAADFMRDEEGHLTFLEVNSQPMFAAFDRIAEGRLCDAIIAALETTAEREKAHECHPGI